MFRTSLLLAALLTACGPVESQKMLTPAETQAADIQSFEALTTQLESKRTQAIDKRAMEIASSHNQLYYLTFPTFSPSLHRLDDVSGTKFHYTFSIGSGNDYNYRASDDLIVTVLKSGNQNTFTAYRLDQPNSVIGAMTVDGPKDEQKWWAYAPSKGDVYFVKTGPAELWKWTPSSGNPPAKVFAFSDLGVTVGEFADFGVDGDQMIFLESGRIWKADLAAKTAKWLGNKTEVYGSVWFDKAGILFTTATGPFYYPLGQADPIDLKKAISATSYRLSATFAEGHYFYEDAALMGSKVFYVGNAGVFVYDLSSKQVAPVLLTPRTGEVRVTYRYPQPLENGALYVVGLESSSGSVGAEGPTWRVAP